MIGRRAFARGSSLWARSFNNQLPRHMAACSLASKSFNFMKVAESPLNGYAEQYRLVDLSGLLSSELASELSDEVDESATTIAEIVNSVSALRTLGILRNYMVISSSTQHYPEPVC
jgi:hypothetical protein